jgi:hypothetical protein
MEPLGLRGLVHDRLLLIWDVTKDVGDHNSG